MHFAQTEIRVPMIGTSFRLSSDTIRIDDSRVIFDDYTLLAPNSKPLTIVGEVDLADFSRMTADIALRASDFQVVDVARKDGTAVYGKAYLDLDATAKGPLDELVVRGNVALLGGTPGALLGMWTFRHKTRHWYFRYGLPALLLVQLAMGTWIAIRVF